MPDNTGSKSWQNLLRDSYSITVDSYKSGRGLALLSAPFNYLFAGYYTYGSNLDKVLEVGAGGWYWSSSASSSTGAHYMMFNEGYIGPQSSSSRGDAWGIRCVAR